MLPSTKHFQGLGAVVSVVLLVLGGACDRQEQNAMARSGKTSASVRLEPAFPKLTFERPVDFQHSGDGTDRVFVVEQAGVIRAFDNVPSIGSAGVFLDIRDKVSRDNNEEGLLGLAFHPAYADNQSFFVYYSAANPRRSILARYSVSADDPMKAVTGSESVLMEIPQPFGNHNGGQIAFGPDELLYVALGDGGAGGDPEGNGQDRTTLLGSILRIDVDKPSGGRPYGIPSDNPFAGNTEGYREEIYAYGLRNPWRFSWDAETGQLWTGDVGQNRYEEIDIIEKGKNYGWDTMEGAHCFEPSSGCNQSGLVQPIFEYGRGDGISITGGFVYRGKALPALQGTYIYGDFGTGTVWGLSFDGNKAKGNRVVVSTDLAIASFGVDRHDEIYVCAFDGKIYKFVK